MTTRRALLGAALAAAGCAPLRRFPFDAGDPPASGSGLQIQYFGVGCFLLSWRGVAVLTDPFWSYLPRRQVALGRIAPDPAQVDPHLPALGDVVAVLVGHSHYDHMLDLPYVAPHLAAGAQIFGSRTLAHTLAPLSVPVVPVNAHLATEARPGTWLAAGPSVRILPIASGHPNNWAFVHVWGDALTEDRATPPTRASHYQEGRTLAFLIDLLRPDGRVAHRVYVQTSSRGLPDGAFPDSIRAERPVDVALLAMDCANLEADGGDTIIDVLAAPAVIFCHWEDFFRSQDRPPREIVKVDLPRLKAHFDADPRAVYRFPGWGSTFSFPDPEQRDLTAPG